MAKTAAEIIDELNDHLTVWGEDYPSCYIGITKDPVDRLFNQHNVDEIYGLWYYEKAISNEEARKVEELLIDLGMQGGHGGGDEDSVYVYCYLIARHTKQ